MPPYRTSKLHEKPSALKREHPALQNVKFLKNFIFVGHFFTSGFALCLKKVFYFFEHIQRNKLLLAPLRSLTSSGSLRELFSFRV